MNELKKKEREEKQKHQDKLEKEMLEKEYEKRRKLQEDERNKTELNKKKIVAIRPLSERKGLAVINGKLHDFFDWSTSPNPAFFNKNEFKF